MILNVTPKKRRPRKSKIPAVAEALLKKYSVTIAELSRNQRIGNLPIDEQMENKRSLDALRKARDLLKIDIKKSQFQALNNVSSELLRLENKDLQKVANQTLLISKDDTSNLLDMIKKLPDVKIGGSSGNTNNVGGHSEKL